MLKDLIEVEMIELSDDELDTSGLEEPGLHEVAGFGSLVLELPTPPRDDPRPEVKKKNFHIIKQIVIINTANYQMRKLTKIAFLGPS